MNEYSESYSSIFDEDDIESFEDEEFDTCCGGPCGPECPYFCNDCLS